MQNVCRHINHFMLLTKAWYTVLFCDTPLHSIKQKKTISTENVSICKLFSIATSSAWSLQTHTHFLKAFHTTKTSNFQCFTKKCDNTNTMQKKDITKNYTKETDKCITVDYNIPIQNIINFY